MGFVVQLAGQTVHIVVIREGIQCSSFVNTAVLVKFPADRVSDLKIVVIVVAGIETFVQFVIRHGMEHIIVCPAGIIAVNHFAHEPEILFFLRSSPAHLLHEIEGQAVRAVQADSVDVKLLDPEMDHIKEIIPHGLLVKIEVHQLEAVSPGLVAEPVVVGAVPAEVHTLVPVHIGRMFPVFLDILEGEKFAAGMVEHTVHHHMDTGFVAFFNKIFEILVVTQTAVHFLIILRVIAVGGGFKERADIDGRHAQVLHMVDPGKKPIHPVLDLCSLIFLRCAQKAQRINMIKNCLVIPMSHCVSYLQIVFY